MRGIRLTDVMVSLKSVLPRRDELIRGPSIAVEASGA